MNGDSDFLASIPLLRQLSDRLITTASNWQGNSYYESDSIQAYRLFVIALAGKPDIGAMTRLYTNNNLSKEVQTATMQFPVCLAIYQRQVILLLFLHIHRYLY